MTTVHHLAGADAYRESVALLADVEHDEHGPAVHATALAIAQVRATQAQAAATALLAIVAAGGRPGTALLSWSDVLGIVEPATGGDQ